MTKTATVLLGALVAMATLLVYGFTVVVTAFVACGISGCSGGGFGPSFSPVAAQVGLLVSGLCLVPAVALALRRQPRRVRVGLAAGAVVGGALLAMVLTGLGPHGCPVGQSRAVVGPEAFDAGGATCSGDRDAVG